MNESTVNEDPKQSEALANENYGKLRTALSSVLFAVDPPMDRSVSVLLDLAAEAAVLCDPLMGHEQNGSSETVEKIVNVFREYVAAHHRRLAVSMSNGRAEPITAMVTNPGH